MKLKDNFYYRMLSRAIENILIFIAGFIVTIGIIAAICGDGDKGLFKLFIE